MSKKEEAINLLKTWRETQAMQTGVSYIQGAIDLLEAEPETTETGEFVKEVNGIIADEPHVCKYCPGENLCNLLGSLNTQCFKQREEIERLTKEVEAGRKLWADAQRARKVRALENDGLRGRISEHQAQLMAKDEEIKQLKVLLKVALCPNTQNGCKDGVYPDPYGQPCRCQWCDEVEQALKGK